MGLLGGKTKTYVYNPDHTSADKMAAAGLKDYQDYNEVYRPAAQKIINTVNDPDYVNNELGSIQARTNSAIASSSGTADRTAQRYGYGMGIQMREATDRNAALDAARQSGAAVTTGRRNLAETREQLADTVSQIGQNVKGMGMTAIQNAAGLEADRNAEGYALAAQKNAREAQKNASKNSAIGKIATVAGTATGFVVGGPMGAWLGAAAGSAAGGMMGGLF